MKRIRTHYDNLKVARNAPLEVIRAAYKTLSQKYHPDLNRENHDAERIIRIINSAYEVLSDPEKRRQHDLWITQQESMYDFSYEVNKQIEPDINQTTRRPHKKTDQFDHELKERVAKSAVKTESVKKERVSDMILRHFTCYWMIYGIVALIVCLLLIASSIVQSNLFWKIHNERDHLKTSYYKTETIPDMKSRATAPDYSQGYDILHAVVSSSHSLNGPVVFAGLVSFDVEKVCPTGIGKNES